MSPTTLTILLATLLIVILVVGLLMKAYTKRRVSELDGLKEIYKMKEAKGKKIVSTYHDIQETPVENDERKIS